MHINLAGKVAIVTGGSRGIGKEIARALAREEVKVVVTGTSSSSLEQASDDFKQDGLEVRTYQCDVRDEARIREVVDDVYANFGRIDILVNNAGVIGGGSIERLPEDMWDLNMDVNLKGTFLMSKAVIPYMKQMKSGRILNAASFAAIVPRIETAAYAASKAGVEQFTKVLAGELGPWNITANCFAPGMIPTDMNGFDEMPDSQKQRLLDTLTIRRWGLMEDVAHLIIYLASDYASYITGTMIDISGGKLVTQFPQAAYERAAEQQSLEI